MTNVPPDYHAMRQLGAFPEHRPRVSGEPTEWHESTVHLADVLDAIRDVAAELAAIRDLLEPLAPLAGEAAAIAERVRPIVSAALDGPQGAGNGLSGVITLGARLLAAQRPPATNPDI